MDSDTLMVAANTLGVVERASDVIKDGRPTHPMSKEDMAIWTSLVSKGIANALYGLSLMVQHQIAVTSLSLKWLPVKEAAEKICGPDEKGVGIYLAIEGDASGHLLMMHDINMAYRIIDIQLGLPTGSTEKMGDMERSILGEMGNITGGFFLNALADATDLVLMPSPPAVMTDLARAMVNLPLSCILEGQDEALMVSATFATASQNIEGRFIVLPTVDFMTTLIGSKAGLSSVRPPGSTA
jgi:chemotaxis protein CheC